MGTDAEKGRYTNPEGNRTWEYLATFACSILMFCIGSAMGWNSPSSVKLTADDSPTRLKSAEVSTLMSIIAIGQMLAPPLNSVIVDRIGRKNTILVTGIPLIISWSIMAVSTEVLMLYAARFAAGLSVGISYCVCYMYVGEIASSTSRGVANVLLTVMFNLGVLVSFIVVPGLTVAENAWLNLILIIAFEFVFWFMPESPHYLAMCDRLDEAEAVLERIRGKCDVSDEMDLLERSLKNTKKLQESQKTSVWTLLFSRSSVRAIVIIGLFSLTHHFGGYMAVMTYGQKIFKDLKVSFVSDHVANIIGGVVQLISVALTSFIVDGWGRKPLVAVSGILAGLCNLVIGMYFFFQEYTNIDVSAYSLLPLVAVFLVVFAFNCGLMIVQAILISELFATEVKALGVCFVTMNGGFMFTISTKLYLMIADTWHCGHSPPFLTFALVVWSVTAVLLRITPETKGKSLLEIQKALIE